MTAKCQAKTLERPRESEGEGREGGRQSGSSCINREGERVGEGEGKPKVNFWPSVASMNCTPVDAPSSADDQAIH